jgi:hypothetical protein
VSAVEGQSVFVNPLARGTVVLVTGVGAAGGAREAAAALACAASASDEAALFVDVGGRPPRPTLLASSAAQGLEERLRAHLPAAKVAARGQLCQIAVPEDEEELAAASAAVPVMRGGTTVLHVPPARWQGALDALPEASGALLRGDPGEDRALLALLVRDLIGRGMDVAVLKRRMSWVVERRALFGALSGGGGQGALPRWICRRLLGEGVVPCDQATNPARL